MFTPSLSRLYSYHSLLVLLVLTLNVSRRKDSFPLSEPISVHKMPLPLSDFPPLPFVPVYNTNFPMLLFLVFFIFIVNIFYAFISLLGYESSNTEDYRAVVCPAL